MIPCKACGNNNPLGTMFCRRCGERLEIDITDVMGSVTQTKQDKMRAAVRRAGRNALGISLFIFFSALILDNLLAPPLPRPTIPPAEPLGVAQLMPADVPWAATDGGAAAATIVVPDASSIDAWRKAHGVATLQQMGVDVAQLRRWQHAIAAQQDAHGGFPGNDPLAATALACLSLQALPGDEVVDAAARRARAWLHKRSDDFLGARHLAAALATLALLDADEMPGGVLRGLTNRLVDGQAAQWQAQVYLQMPPAARAESIVALSLAVRDDPGSRMLLQPFVQQGAGDPPPPPPQGDAVAALDATGRVTWALAAWIRPYDPQLLARSLASWSGSAQVPQAPESIRSPCGPQADQALAVLACSAPARAPIWRLGGGR